LAEKLETIKQKILLYQFLVHFENIPCRRVGAHFENIRIMLVDAKFIKKLKH
jgi:hypothetical protein